MLDMRCKSGLIHNHLAGDCCEKLIHFATVAIASLEEEAGTEVAAKGEGAGDSAGNGGLSSAGHAVEPEYSLGLRIVSPFVYLAKKIDSSVWVTCCAFSLSVGVESGTVGAG